MPDCVVPPALLRAQVSQVVVRGGVVGIALQCRLVLRAGRLQVAFDVSQHAAVVVLAGPRIARRDAAEGENRCVHLMALKSLSSTSRGSMCGTSNCTSLSETLNGFPSS